MLIKTAELSGVALDWAVANCEGWLEEADDPNDGKEFVDTVHSYGHCHYSSEWLKAGPIIDRELIATRAYDHDVQKWSAEKSFDSIQKPGVFFSTGPTPLIAAMRCYVASKLGAEVDIPLDLTGDH